MKQDIFSLTSIVPYGVGGIEAGALNIIYSVLLHEAGQHAYRYIVVNQIGDDVNELVLKDGKKIYVNIRYPAYEDFESRPPAERNRIRLDIAHNGLLRIAAKEGKLDVEKLNAIRALILEKDFEFEFPMGEFPNRKDPGLIARIILAPRIDKFEFYVSVCKEQVERMKLLVYSGNQTGIYINALFQEVKWNTLNELIIKGESLESEFKVLVDEKRFEEVNKSSFKVAPYLEMMRAGITEERRKEMGELWEKDRFSSLGYSLKPLSNKPDSTR